MTAKTIIVEKHEHITENTDGTRTLDLDAIFGDSIKTDDERELDGYPYQTVSLNSFSNMKLASDPRLYTSRFTGETSVLHDFYSFGGWDEKHYARTEYQGNMVQGPYAFASKMGSMITSTPDPDEYAYLVNDGDTVIFMGYKFKVSSPKNTRYSDKRVSFHLI